MTCGQTCSQSVASLKTALFPSLTKQAESVGMTRLPVRGTGLEPVLISQPEPKGGRTNAKALDLLESESPGSARNGQVETEYLHSAQVRPDAVELAIQRALHAWRCQDPNRARTELLAAEALVLAALAGGAK